jgi:hypothetical protein
MSIAVQARAAARENASTAITVMRLTGEIVPSARGEVSERARPLAAQRVRRRCRHRGRGDGDQVETKGDRVDVLLHGVGKHAPDLGPALFSFDAKIVVTTSGRESFRCKVVPDVGYLPRSLVRCRDREEIYLGRLEIEVPIE